MLKYRQGDVGIQVIDSLPEGLEFRTVRSAVLAEGEVTGHFHVLTCTDKEFVKDQDARYTFRNPGGPSDGTEYPLQIAEKDGTMYLKVAEPLPLKHQEHSTITIEPGTYKVQRQVEYTPEAPRIVVD